MSSSEPPGSLLPGRAPLDALFSPRSIAVIGATETAGSVGHQLMTNLLAGRLAERVYPVNPGRKQVLGRRSHDSITSVPGPVDLAVIAVAAPAVPAVLLECGEAGAKAAVIIGAGFREVGSDGVALEEEVRSAARDVNVRLLGPNSMGFIRPWHGLNASFASTSIRSGSVALLSESGSLMSAILDWGAQQHVGFSAAVSVGTMADVGWGEVISYFGNDPRTRSILLYLESVGDARSFLSAAREVALEKPVLLLHGGRSPEGARAAATHTGAMVAPARVLDAAARRTGMLRVETVAALFHTAEVLSKQQRPAGPRLAIVTNAGGPALLAADALVAEGGRLASLDESAASPSPIDLTHEADTDDYTRALGEALSSSHVDGALTILTPGAGLDPAEVARSVAGLKSPKPLLASWMGGDEVQAGAEVLNEAGIPTFPFPDTAARVFAATWRYTYNLRGLLETPSLPEDLPGLPDRPRARKIVDRSKERQPLLLSESEAKDLLDAYGIPVVPTEVVHDTDAAVEAARRMGFPVALKLHSRSVAHKSDVGGVKLGIRSEEAVRRCFDEIRDSLQRRGIAEAFEGASVQPMIERYGVEVIVGMHVDPTFGPVLLFGAGGRLAEIHADAALGLPPLNTTLARRMMEQTRVFSAFRDQPETVERLEDLLVRFSQIVIEHPRLREFEINPLLATPDGLLALDARGRLHPPSIPDARLPRPAIRPYPTEYVESVTLKDGTAATIRPIRPEDEPLLVRFHEVLGEESVYMRYASSMNLEGRVAHDRLARRCFIDYDREMALIAEVDQDTDDQRLLGVGRLTQMPGGREAEFAILIADEAQGQGLGTLLLERLVAYGRRQGVKRIVAEILARNRAMQEVSRKVGFTIVPPEDYSDPTVQAVLDL